MDRKIVIFQNFETIFKIAYFSCYQILTNFIPVFYWPLLAL